MRLGCSLNQSHRAASCRRPRFEAAGYAQIVSEANSPVQPGLRRVARDSVVYGAGFFLGKIASLLLLPLYTRLLTPSDYGVLQLLQITSDVVDIVTAGGLTSSVVRFVAMATDDGQRRSIIATAFWSVVGTRLLGGVLIAIFASSLSQLAFKTTEHTSLVRLSGLNFVVGALSIVPLLELQASRRARAHGVASVLKLVFQLALTALFVVKFHWGVRGVLYSSLFAAAAQAVVLVPPLLRRPGMSASLAEYRRLTQFGRSYQFAAVAAFILSFSDRLVLSVRSTEEVGLYGLASQVSLLLSSLIAEPFGRAWEPALYSLRAYARERQSYEAGRGLLLLIATMVVAATAMSLFAQPGLQLMSSAPFWGAARLVPVLAFAQVVRSWGDFSRTAINLEGDTRPVMRAAWSGAAVTLVLFPLLVPVFGAGGAAASSCVGLTVRTLVLRAFARRILPVSSTERRALGVLLVGVLASSIAFTPIPESIWWRTTLFTFAFAVFCAVLWRRAFVASERELLLSMVRSRLLRR